MAFGNGVLMRGPHYWAWAREDGTVMDRPVRTLLERHRCFRLPVIRSAVSFAEMIGAVKALAGDVNTLAGAAGALAAQAMPRARAVRAMLRPEIRACYGRCIPAGSGWRPSRKPVNCASGITW